MNFEKKKIGQNINNKILVCKVVFHLLPCISFKKKGDMSEISDKLRCLCLGVCVRKEEPGIMGETENFRNVSKIHTSMFS